MLHGCYAFEDLYVPRRRVHLTKNMGVYPDLKTDRFTIAENITSAVPTKPFGINRCGALDRYPFASRHGINVLSHLRVFRFPVGSVNLLKFGRRYSFAMCKFPIETCDLYHACRIAFRDFKCCSSHFKPCNFGEPTLLLELPDLSFSLTYTCNRFLYFNICATDSVP